MSVSRRRRWREGTGAALVLCAVVVAACQNESPTGVGPDLPAQPITVEFELPWSDFASNLTVLGGYGTASELGVGVAANTFAGALNARTLMRFQDFPDAVSAVDSTGTLRADTLATFVGGRLVALVDTIASTNAGPVTFGLGALQTEWDARTVTWTAAVDTINDTQAWPEPGAGPVTDLGTAVWDPATGDSVIFAVDSATIAAWADSTDASRGARLELLTAGERVQIRSAQLRLDARPSFAPDTIVEVGTGVQETTFVYDPEPPVPTDVRIGGTPSWRTVLDVGLPAQLAGPPQLCAVVSCPLALDATQISFAAHVLTSQASDPAFQPTDSVSLDVRAVLSRSALPKSPLGPSFIDNFLGRRVAGEAFSSQPGQEIEVPITTFVRELVAGETEDGQVPPNTLALLSVFEPLSIAYASFVGPDAVGEPRLRFVLTIGPAVELP